MGVPKEELYKMIDKLSAEKIEILGFFLDNLINSNKYEDKKWLDADLSKLPDYEWGEEGVPAGSRVSYVPEIGLILKSDVDSLEK